MSLGLGINSVGNTDSRRTSFSMASSIMPAVYTAVLLALSACDDHGVSAQQEYPSSEHTGEFSAFQSASLQARIAMMQGNLNNPKKMSPEMKKMQDAALFISIAFSDNPAFFRWFQALIMQESGWDPGAESRSGAKGLGQITSIIFTDMLDRERGRPRMYQNMILHTYKTNNVKYLDYLPESVVNAMDAFVEKQTPKSWDDLVYELQKNQNDPYTNLLISAMVLESKTRGIENPKSLLREAATWKELGEDYKSVNIMLRKLPENELKLAIAVMRYNANPELISVFSNKDYLQTCVTGENHFDPNTDKTILAQEQRIHLIRILWMVYNYNKYMVCMTGQEK